MRYLTPYSESFRRDFHNRITMLVTLFMVVLFLRGASDSKLEAQEKAVGAKSGKPLEKTPTKTPATTSPAKKPADNNSAGGGSSAPNNPAQTADSKAQQAAEEDAAELAKQKLVVDRFVTVLERNPRRGTAFDKIYGFHIENGTVEALAQQFRDRTAKKADDYAAWMILGLIESQRGRDAAAVEAFAKAKAVKKDDPIAPYYHGQALVLIGRGDEAVPSFEEAIARKPVQTDLFEIIQALGRVHQRAQRTAQALEVWNQFEKAFPGDARVQEQIAGTLVEEGQFAEALPRYETLIKTVRDDYRKTTFQIEAAELKVKLKRTSEGVADLEGLLSKLNPDSWLFREVRRKIENVFLRTEDQEGLVKYYLTWVGKHDDDVDAMARLSRLLARQARVPEAREWLDKALKLAPSRKELRLAFIQQLVEDHRFGDAIEQYKLLDQAEPNNPDYLREWGRLVMRDGSRPLEAKRADAAQIWKKLLASRGTDPLATVQVADLLRNAGLTDEALPLYEKAVTLAPTAPQYKEFLGEYQHLLKRPEQALATWRKIAEGKQRTPENLARLAEVLAQFGYAKEASTEILAAAELDARDFSLQLRAADYQARAEQLDGALASLGRAESLSQNEEEREAVLAQRMRILGQLGKLTQVTEELRVELEKETAKDGAAAEKWYRLARYQESLRLLPEAAKAIAKSLELAPANIPALSAAARIDEQAGAVASAIERFRKLSAVDRRSRSDYLTQIARLEVQMGRADEALAAGRDLIAASPGNIEAYQFFADLCFRLNQREEGLTALRRSVRANPTDPAALLPLASALANDFRTDEAIEIYWQAFEKGGAIDDKLTVIGKLAELYMQQGQFDRLVERLDRNRREEDARREMTICLAQAHQSAGDIGLARQELQSLLTDDSRDTALLQQVSKLAEADRDLPTAIRFQEMLVKAAPAPETEMRLAQLYTATGDTREASAIFVRLAQREEDPERLMRIVDGLLGSERNEEVLAILEPKLRENSRNWEYLYREGVALFPTRKMEAAARFRAILALDAPDDELGIVEKSRQAKANRSGSGPVAAVSAATATRLNPIYRVNNLYEIRRGIGLEADNTQSTMMARTVWTPNVYFMSRAAAIGWLSRIASTPPEHNALEKELREKSDAVNSSIRQNWDWIYYTTVVLQTGDKDRDAARKLAKKGDLAGQLAFLSDISSRPENRYIGSGSARGRVSTTASPLPAEELEEAQKSLQGLIIASDDPSNSLYNVLPRYAQMVSIELKRAKREEDAKKLIEKVTARAKNPQQIATAMSMFAAEGNVAAATEAFDRFTKQDLAANDNRTPAAISSRTAAANGLCQVIGIPGTKIEVVRDLFDRYFNYYVARNELRRNDRIASRPGPSGPSRAYYTSYVGGQGRTVSMAFPPPGPYWDAAGLNVLRNTFDAYVAADLASDFTAELEKRRTAATGASVIYLDLARAYVEFWAGEKESAAQHFAKAAAQAPHDLQLQFELASLHWQSQNIEEALAVLDRIQPSDQKLVIQKENAALQFAQQLGDLDRATIAAKRLFGMRLDMNTQMQLAESMRRLGMGEEAESMLKRAERQTSSRGAALAALMTQYLVEGKNDLAAEAAYRVLRTTRATGASGRGGQSQDDLYRQSALRCLQQTGKLKDQIMLLEAQLERSPQSEPIYTALGEYYIAAGDAEKAEGLQTKLLALRPDDADLRYRVARTFMQTGKGKEACQLFLESLRKKPSLFANQYYEIVNVFRSQKRMPDLAKLLSEIDLRQLGQYYVVESVISSLVDNPADMELAVTLVRRAIETYPEMGPRAFLPSYDARILRMPEIAALAKKSLVPPIAKAKREPWSQSGSNVSHSGDGTITFFEANLFEISTPAELAELRAQVQQTLKEAPQWSEGHVLLAMICARGGDYTEAKKQFEALKAMETGDYQALYGIWRVAQEFRRVPELRTESIELYQLAEKAWRVQNRGGSYGPGTALASLLVEQGDKDAGRKLILATIDSEESPVNMVGYNEYQRCNRLLQAAQQLEEIGFATDALRLNRDLASYAKKHQAAILSYTSNEGMSEQAEAASARLVEQLMEQADRAWITELFRPSDPSKDASPIDLFLISASSGGGTRNYSSYEYDEEGRRFSIFNAPGLKSLLVTVLQEKSADAALREQLKTQIDKLAVEYPRDIPVAVAQSIYALAKSPPESQKAALERLEKLVEASPLEELAAGKRPNARQRAAAAPQMGLWFVAKECLQKPEWKTLGGKLADRAMAAAQRQTGDSTSEGLTFELAASSAARGDLPAAETAYRRLIEHSVTPKLVKVAALASGEPPASSSPANAAPPPRSAQPRRAPVTLSQYQLATGIAEKSAQLGLLQVSLDAMREALSAGLPVPDAQGAGNPLGGVATTARMRTSRNTDGSAIGAEVTRPLLAVIAAWSRAKAPPADVCQILESVVMPTTRPREILISSGVMNRTGVTDRGLLGALAEWAVRGNRVAEIEKQVAERKGTVDSAIAGETLLLYVALEREDSAAISQQIKALGDRVKSATTATAQRTLQMALMLVFDRPEFQKEVAPHVAALLKATVNSPSAVSRNFSSGAPPLLRKLIRYEQAEGRSEQAKSLIEDFLKARIAVYGSMGSSEDSAGYQHNDYAWAASELSRQGDLKVTLETAGRLADAPAGPNYYGVQWDSMAVWNFMQAIEKLPAAERYAVLKEWSLPTPQRRSIRSLAAGEISQLIPNEFARPFGYSYRTAQPRNILSSLRLFVSTAAEVGKLEEVAELARPLVEEKLPHSTTLALLLATAKKDTASAKPLLAQIDARIAEELAKLKDNEEGRYRNRPMALGDAAEVDAILAVSALGDLRETGVTILRRMQASPYGSPASLGQLDQGGERVHRLTTLRDAPEEAWAATPLRFWSLGSFTGYAGPDAVASRAFPYGDAIYCLNPYASSGLQFRSPLTGDWKLSFEGKDCSFAFGGATASLDLDQRSEGEADRSIRTRQMVLGNLRKNPEEKVVVESGESWSRYEIESAQGKVRFLVNGQVIYEDVAPGLGSPWITISHANGFLPTSLRRLQLSGEPKVLGSVDLFAGDDARGWYNFENAGQRGISDHASRALKPTGEGKEEDSTALDKDAWVFEKGVVKGSRNQTLPKTDLRGITYRRALEPGDRLSYEFYYEPGQELAHPAIGNLGLVLKPEGVHLAWLERADADSEAVELVPTSQLTGQLVKAEGSKPLELKAKDWNSAEFSLIGDELHLKINGQLMLARPLEKTISRQFSLFHYPRESALQVRSAKLEGNWPPSLAADDLANLLAWENSPATPQQTRVAMTLAGEVLLSESSSSLLTKSPSLAAAERYETLHNWVLPTAAKPLFREWLEIGAPLGAGAAPGGKTDLVSSPALALLSAAQEAGKLAELKAELLELTKASQDSAAAEVLLAMVAVTEGDETLAKEKLERITDRVRKSPALQIEENPRGAWLAAYVALSKSGTRPAATALATALTEDHKKPDRNPSSDWTKAIDVLGGLVRAANSTTPIVTTQEIAAAAPGWTAMPHSTAKGDSPASQWSAAQDRIELFTSTGPVNVSYALPLTGKFSVACQVRRAERGLLLPSYAGIAIYPAAEENTFLRFAQGEDDGKAFLPLENPGKLGDWFDYRLDVEGDLLTISINGKRALQEKLSGNSDPWLKLAATSPAAGGALRQLSITGSPTIPRELALSKGVRLSGWSTEFYGEPEYVSASAAAAAARRQGYSNEMIAPASGWRLEKDEISAISAPDRKDCLAESLVRYERPLAPGEELSLEFYYEPGKTELSPALGRTAFLLKPEGIALHQLTKLPFSTEGPALDNQAPLPGAKPISRPIPLKASQWNTLRLVLAGDQVKLTINGEEVASVPRDQTEPAYFGLFRRKNHLGAKVKNVMLQGAWPQEMVK